MAFPLRESPYLIVTIAGTAMPLAFVDQCTDGVSPECGSASIRIAMGRRLVNGAIVTADPVAAIRATVNIAASDGSYSWDGEVVSTEEVASDGRRWLNVNAAGDLMKCERAYLSTWRETDYQTTLPFQTFAGRDLNAFGNADCSAGTFTIGAADVHVSDVYDPSRTLWDQTKAINSILAIAAADAGLPTITLDDPDGLMVKSNTWGTAGKSVHAMLATVIGQRSDVTWRLARDGADIKLRVRAARGGGAQIDLTSEFIANYSRRVDGTTTLASARHVGARQQFVLTAYLYPASTGSDLLQDWTSADEAAAAAGDLNSPAYRRFRLDPAISLPDSSSVGNGKVMGGIPAQVVDVAGGVVIGGPGYSSQGIVVWQDAVSGAWQSLAGKVGISRRDDQCGLWFDGEEWLDVFKSAYRIGVTLAVESALHSQVVATEPGDGEQWGFISAPGEVCQMLNGTAIGVSDNGTLITYGGSAPFRDDISAMQELIDAWWEWYRRDLQSVSWTELGVFSSGFEPGDVVSSALMFKDDGGSTKVEAVDSAITRRTVRYNEKGASVSYTSQRLPPDLNAIMGALS